MPAVSRRKNDALCILAARVNINIKEITRHNALRCVLSRRMISRSNKRGAISFFTLSARLRIQRNYKDAKSLN